MRKLVQIAILLAIVVPMLFLAPTFSSKTLVGESRSLKKFDAIECSLGYSIFQIGLNHRYTYVVDSNGSTEMVEDLGWRFDSSERIIPTRQVKHGIVNGTGTVEYVAFLGFYGIVGDDGYPYEPLRSLPSEFAVDGLRVWFSLRLCEDCASVLMWGHVAEVILISRL